MNQNQLIKPGLEYAIKTLPANNANNSFLNRYADSVALSCTFSGLDCGISNTDVAGSYHIEFVFYEEYLSAFSHTLDFEINQFPLQQQHDLCCNTQMILHEIVTCKLDGIFRNMFLESKALSLLLCFQKCFVMEEKHCESCKFLTKSVEKDKILKAKEIILSRLNNPPTIQELSIEAGINQCYLKKGFKEVFGLTVYDFVQEQRMLKAKMLLTTSGFSVTQVADHIGFSSISNFSSAFKKYTGIFPSELQQN